MSDNKKEDFSQKTPTNITDYVSSFMKEYFTAKKPTTFVTVGISIGSIIFFLYLWDFLWWHYGSCVCPKLEKSIFDVFFPMRFINPISIAVKYMTLDNYKYMFTGPVRPYKIVWAAYILTLIIVKWGDASKISSWGALMVYWILTLWLFIYITHTRYHMYFRRWFYYHRTEPELNDALFNNPSLDNYAELVEKIQVQTVQTVNAPAVINPIVAPVAVAPVAAVPAVNNSVAVPTPVAAVPAAPTPVVAAPVTNNSGFGKKRRLKKGCPHSKCGKVCKSCTDKKTRGCGCNSVGKKVNKKVSKAPKKK